MFARCLRANNIAGCFKFNTAKKFFSEAFGNCIKFSETLNSNEIKIPIKDNINVIYFNKDENLEAFKNKIKGIDKQYIQKLAIKPFDDKTEFTNETKVQDIIKKPFEIQINSHLTIKHFPSLNLVITSIMESQQNLNINDPNNHYLYLRSLQELAGKKDISQEALKAELNKLFEIYQKLQKEYTVGEEKVEKLVLKKRYQFMTMGILYFIAHLIIFFVLIYHISAWDNIEPYTYIVGNVYWIACLAFFIVMMRRLDMSFVFSTTFTNYFLNKYRFLYGCNPVERTFFQREMTKIAKFLNSIR
jgi:hypothetical protein